MVKVSALLITVRWGGVEWQLYYLSQQTRPVDEFIVVDGFYDLRHGTLMKMAKELGVNLIHLREPELSYHTSHNRCSNVNFAIAHARNPLCVFIDDWHVIPDNFIESHIALHNAGYAGVVRWVHTLPATLATYDQFARWATEHTPTMKDARLRYARKDTRAFTHERGQEWINEHVEDTRIKILNKKFDRDVTGHIITDIPVDWWWPNSTSAPLESLLAVNGFDETFNGGGGCEDVDIATRMSHLGLRYAMDPRLTCYHVDTTYLPVRPTTKPLCIYHDRTPFTYNEYHKGDPDLVENEQLVTWKLSGVKFCKCKICGWQGLIDSSELLRSKREGQIVQAPLKSLGIQRTNLRLLRLSIGLPPYGPVTEERK